MNAKDPCPYCGRIYTATTRWQESNRANEPMKVRDIDDHDCPSFRTEEPLPSIDPSFQVIPSRTDAEKAEALDRYRKSLR